MKILLLCGYFDELNEAEVIQHAKRAVEFSANQFQKKLIHGFRESGHDVAVVSAPFIGSYPNASDIRFFRGFEHPQETCRYVSFHNLWGLRNVSRAAALKKEIRFFVEDPEPEKMIVAYCPHTPFLEAAAFAKRKDPRIRICFYVPDLPNYMNLDANRSRLYDMAKFVDNTNMKRYMRSVDTYVLLTEHMKKALPVGEKPCMVIEGIIEKIPPAARAQQDGLKRVVYAGKLNEKFGVKDLIDGFRMVHDPEYRLVLCGTGDCMPYAEEAAKQDSRILLMGQVSPAVALECQRKASVLINPRPNNEVYTRYSFPSKMIEYLMTGKPVIAYLLDGMPSYYGDFLFLLDNCCPGPEAIKNGIMNACAASEQLQKEKYLGFVRYAQSNLKAIQIVEKMIKMTM